MKNIIIGFLVITVGVFGYLLFSKDKTPSTQDTATNTELSNASTGGKEINLSGKGLKEISKDILDDSSVTKLDVSNNNLTGSLPGEIRKLTNLEVLIASDNNMTGVPAEIGQLSKLKTINFANNNLTGLPMELGNLKNLETLDLRGNPTVSQNDIGLIQKQIPDAKILTD